MYIHEFKLKDGECYLFYTNKACVPEKIKNFAKEHKKEIEYRFCDYVPQTVDEWFRGETLKDNDKYHEHYVICE